MSRTAKLKSLRAARSGINIISDHSDSEQDSYQLYDTVDEEEYRKRKRKEILEDDFIVDDNGEGYVDTGADEWERGYYDDQDDNPDYDDQENEDPLTTKHKTKPKKVKQINQFFTSTESKVKPVKSLKVDDILNDFQSKPTHAGSPFQVKSGSKSTMFGGNKRAKLENTQMKKKVGLFSSERKRKLNPSSSSIVNNDEINSEDIERSIDVEQHLDQPKPDIKEMNSSPIKQKVISLDQTQDEESDEELLISRRARTANTEISREVNMRASIVEEKAADADSSSSPTRSRSIMTSSPSKVTKLGGTDLSEGPVLMYWLDYVEVNHKLLLFGKVRTSSGALVSAMVQVGGVHREIYILPRSSYRSDSSAPCGPMDVHEEITPLLLEKYGLKSIRAKPVTMKYAFELPGVPSEADYLKILLPHDTPLNADLALPSSLEGETFQRVFGGHSALFEDFVLQKDVMGPCWLEISNPDFDSMRNSSHCRVEMAIQSPKDITVYRGTDLTAPNLTVLGITVQTVMNTRTNNQEVAAVSIATFNELPQELPIPEDLQPDELITLIRPLGDSTVFPPGVQRAIEKQGLKIRCTPNEKTLLNLLCALVKRADPDVFVGHRIESIQLDVLVHRLYDLKVPTWSSFGRLNKKVWPDRFPRRSGGPSKIREIFHGRLLCDIGNDMGQSLTTKCQSWDLPEMYQSVCGKTFKPSEIALNNPQLSENVNLLLTVAKEGASMVQITSEITFRIQILSLSKILTNLAGNAWSHTLGGTRAGRNEFILLHEFRKNGYIVPDKENYYQKHQQQQLQDQSPEDDETTKISSKKNNRFKGGLVFEPEKGLHRNIVLVLDFNSLYPSIIQEFNICFTTVERESGNVDTIPPVPVQNSQQGVLPRLLANLVSRRREVKKLLKDSKIGPVEKAQFDIKQQALKLTANSMYGCLGYVNSRFYARPLAMLVTSKGREILMDTRQLAESLGLKVVYGDTDSVMIDSGTIDYQEAIAIGEDLKAKVNERYSLLEIDIDNVFKRILLHAKKKYAAMNLSLQNGKMVSQLEVKGLDMRRREYCQLSKEISTHVLEQILGENDSDEALSDIYQYLETMGTKIRENSIPITKFNINTKLSKDPAQYANAGGMPQVQVALRLRGQGKVVKAGTVVSFIVTAGDDNLSVAERARPLAEVLATPEQLRPDPDYYLEKQIFAPVERLVERLEGVDLVRLAKCLGLDSGRYARIRTQYANGGANGDDLLQPLESCISDAERFKGAATLELTCTCGAHFAFEGIQESSSYTVTFSGIQCSSCGTQLSSLRVASQLERLIRHHISLYYAGWLECDDVSCGVHTRQVSVYGKRCIGNTGRSVGCKGVISYVYTDRELYNQLLYLESLFDVDKARRQELRPLQDDTENKIRSDSGETKKGISQSTLDALAEQNRDTFGAFQSVVQKYFEQCGRRYVDMGSLFNFS
ncbi:hypothetical protein LJB42_001186 [Komagataella kurtzmanii]|nr:hypothetical protein LJB42_001186 [Komagataella kurtzmanii]